MEYDVPNLRISIIADQQNSSISDNASYQVFNACTSLDDVTPWCYTRVDERGHFVAGQWGYCPASCRGQRVEHESGYNLALARPDLWTTALVDLSSWGAGLCHTYNPPRPTEPGVSGQFYAFFGGQGKVFPPNIFLGFNIYIHDKGEKIMHHFFSIKRKTCLKDNFGLDLRWEESA